MDDKLSILQWVELSSSASRLELQNNELTKVINLMARYIKENNASNWEIESIIRYFTLKANEKNMEEKR